MTHKNVALIIIDVQNDFMSGGALAVPNADEVVDPIVALSRKFDAVVLTQDWHPAGHGSFASSHEWPAPFSVIQAPYGPQVLWPDHCVQGSRGAEFRLPDEVMNKAALVLRKGTNPDVDSYSAFLENDKETRTGLAGWLRERGIDTVVMCGLALDYCVAYSALDAISEGFRVILPVNATRGIAEGTIEDQSRAMADAGVIFCDDENDLDVVLRSIAPENVLDRGI